MGKKKYVYMYVWLGPHAVQWKKENCVGEITIKKNNKKKNFAEFIFLFPLKHISYLGDYLCWDCYWECMKLVSL